MSTSPDRPWRIATRRSKLAQAQAAQLGEQLTAVTGRSYELVPMATTGDEHPDRAIESFDVKGLFVDRTRGAVLDGDCDLVVHSFKDLPTDQAEGLVIGAVPTRIDPRDVLVTREGWRLATLPRGGRPLVLGTSSARRKAQVQKARRDVLVQPIRGNLDTRLQKVVDGVVDGIVIAMAGLLRLNPSGYDLKVAPLEHGECLHAPGQGALAVECRVDDAPTRKALRKVDDADARACTTAEREMMLHLGGGCTAPIGAHAEPVTSPDGTRHLELLGLLSDENGTSAFRASHRTAITEPELLGRTLAATLLANSEGVLHQRHRPHAAGEHRH